MRKYKAVLAVSRPSKSGVPATVPWVRIPPAPPLRNDLCMSDDRVGASISTAKVFLRSNPQSLTLDCRGLQVCFFLKLPLTARILALRRGSMPDGAFLRFKIATVRADCDFVFGRINNSNRKMEWILQGKFSAQVPCLCENSRNRQLYLGSAGTRLRAVLNQQDGFRFGNGMGHGTDGTQQKRRLPDLRRRTDSAVSAQGSAGSSEVGRPDLPDERA